MNFIDLPIRPSIKITFTRAEGDCHAFANTVRKHALTVGENVWPRKSDGAMVVDVVCHLDCVADVMATAAELGWTQEVA